MVTKLTIGWLSNSRRSATGYGNQTNLFVPALKGAGYDPTIFAFYGAEGSASIDSEGIVTLPRLQDAWCNDVVEAHMVYTKAELLISLIDPWVLDPAIYKNLPWCAWTPIDSAPMLPANAAVLEHAKWIWAMSRFGEEQLRAAGLADKTMYVPHGVDTEVFTPIDRAEARAKLSKAWSVDLTGKFLIVMNSANKGQPSRKGFSEAIQAFALFSSRHADALLYIHTDYTGMIGEHLPDTIKAFGVDPSKVIFPLQYHYNMGMLSDKHLNGIYNAADVFLQTSHGEGFGIPIVEAQAAGCPVAVTDFSAMSELCLSGWKFPGIPVAHAPGAFQVVPVVAEVVAALEAAYKEKSSDFLRLVARSQALAYDYKRVLNNYMLPALEKIADDILRVKARQKNRQEMRDAARAKREADHAEIQRDALNA